MEKISKAQVKLVRSLQQKKFRDETGLFVAEGEKCVEELRKGFEVEWVVVVESRKSKVESERGTERVLWATEKEIEQMSGLRTPQGVIGVFRKGERGKMKDEKGTKEDLIVALDGVQDPGNLGTIIRTCDWFGVHELVCSLDTADCYNPKVVQATMGALARVRVHYVNLAEWLREPTPIPSLKGRVNIYGTLLDGDDMYEVVESQKSKVESRKGEERGKRKEERGKGIIVMGNEGNGISEEVRKLVTHPIRIPSYPKDAETSESLNVSIATAIVLAEFRR